MNNKIFISLQTTELTLNFLERFYFDNYYYHPWIAGFELCSLRGQNFLLGITIHKYFRANCYCLALYGKTEGVETLEGIHENFIETNRNAQICRTHPLISNCEIAHEPRRTGYGFPNSNMYTTTILPVCVSIVFPESSETPFYIYACI